MANFVYNKAKESFISQSPALDLDTDTIKCALTTGTLTATDQYYSAISASTVGTPQTLTSVTVVNGKFSSAAVSFSAVTITAGKVILYKDTGTGTTSPLIAAFDTGTAIPITVTSGTVTVTPDATNGWFSI